jgi:hypothetical protein
VVSLDDGVDELVYIFVVLDDVRSVVDSVDIVVVTRAKLNLMNVIFLYHKLHIQQSP